MVRLVNMATCNLNQWAMDFEGNLQRIRRSIREAKRMQCTFRVGPELEITGYGCEDHFLENDTYVHAWESIRELLIDSTTDGILCDIGMPVMHRNVGYNCRVFLLNRKVVLIRPKLFMANDGNYRELRYFTPWGSKSGKADAKFGAFEDYFLPRGVRDVCGQEKVPIGVGAIATLDTVVASETCEELFAPDSPHTALCLDGVEIIANGSGSHHQLRKLHTRLDLIRGATSKSGGAYLYANQQGCDGGRLYYDGCSMVMMNGKLLAQASQFSMSDVEVVAATVDLEEIRSYRTNNISGRMQASTAPAIPRVEVSFCLTRASPSLALLPAQAASAASGAAAGAAVAVEAVGAGEAGSGSGPRAGSVDFLAAASAPIAEFEHGAMEEIAYGPSCYLWDYLRRSGQRGFFLPLSGGADSSSTAAIVGLMCQGVVEHLQELLREKEALEGTLESDSGAEYARLRLEEVQHALGTHLHDIRRVTRTQQRAAANTSAEGGAEDDSKEGGNTEYTPSDWRELCGRVLFTCYMASEHSGAATRARALDLSHEIGATHSSIAIDAITDALKQTYHALQTHPCPSPYNAPGSETAAAGSSSSSNSTFRTYGAAAGRQAGAAGGAGMTMPTARFKKDGGTSTEDLALQNIQARSRMVMSYMLAQLLPWAMHGQDGSWQGNLLVLGSANVDEALRGYYTKYDCSAADINPIGAICKRDLKRFLLWCAAHKQMPVLRSVAEAAPSAELTGAEGVQSDELDMGMSYDELGDMGMLRKVEHMGPVSMFQKLLGMWADRNGDGDDDGDAKGGQSASSASAAAAEKIAKDVELIKVEVQSGNFANAGKLQGLQAQLEACQRPAISGSIRNSNVKTYAEKVAQKVKDFFFYYSINRHKMTTLTPSYHAESYSPDDNRFDLRQFLYRADWKWQFNRIDEMLRLGKAQQTGS